jgi:outer membrane autotransporter protein
VNPTLAFGILLDGSKADLDHGAGDTDIDSLRVAVYGTWGACTGWYSDFLLGYGKHDLETDRDTIFGSVDNSTDADSIQALWTVGYTFASGDLRHGPFGGFEYQHVDSDGFDEEAIEDVPVSVDDYEVDSLRALIGYRVDATYGKFRPYASIAYAHEFGDDDISTTASLGGIFGGASFDVTGPDLSSAVLLSAGTGYSINESLTLDVGYRGEISVGDDGVDSHGGSIGLNWTF